MQRSSGFLGVTGAALVLFLGGCTTEFLYREEVVYPAAESATSTVKAFPWPILTEVANIAEGTPKTAIKGKVGYWRKMGLLRVEKSGVSETKVERDGENYSSERWEELR